MRLNGDDTIAAISTAVGEGGIGIVRISGDKAIDIADRITKKRKSALNERRSHSILLNTVIDPSDGSEIDEVLVSIMRAPNTYTKEDIVEINCHGGIVPLRKTLSIVLEAGARAAEPGEFTKRAFLNGRIDLAQAEAVIDTIKAKTDTALKAAINQLEGGISKKIKDITDDIAEVLAQVEAAVDFSDEDIETLPTENLIIVLDRAEIKLDNLIRTAIKGKVLREGVCAAIIGRPNVGKSSLLNAILRKERAIVTSIPGTTRDVIEEAINIKGIPLILKDTAGIREASDEIERIGIELSKKAIQTAELVICVVDGSQGVCKEDIALINEIDSITAVLVINKIDVAQKNKAMLSNRKELEGKFKDIVEISALTGSGIDILEDKLEEIILEGSAGISEGATAINARHEQLVKSAVNNIRQARKLIKSEQPEEIIATLLRDSISDLNGITGETIGEDILSRIFSQFCIGK